MPTIPLTKGYEAIVDDADFPLVSAFKWCAKVARTTVYARRSPTPDNPIRYMHHMIMGTTAQVDHEDTNGLNNRRSNLRLATCTQNLANSRKRKGCSSKYKGVTWNRARNKWQAYLSKETKFIHLGLYSQEFDAAQAYNLAAALQFGEFARLN